MIDKGILEIGGIRTEVALEDLGKLKFILDGLGIMHIIEDVTLFRPYDSVERMDNNHDIEMWKAKNDGSVSSKIKIGPRKDLELRELIIPHFLLIDVFSLAQLDSEEAEFLSDLIYGTEH